MITLNKTSLVASVASQMTVGDYEKFLNSQGLTGGYYPISGWDVTMADCLKERIPNLYFLKYGGLDKLCVGGKAYTSKGQLFDLKIAPRSATGPDLHLAILGGGGHLACYREVALRLFPIPEAESWGIAFCKKSEAAFEIFRSMTMLMINPLFARILHDEDLDSLTHKLNLPSEGDSALFFKLSGLKSMVEAEKDALMKLNEGKKILFYWPTKISEKAELDSSLINEEGLHLLLNLVSPLVGRAPRSKPTKGELNLMRYLEKYPNEKDTPC